MKKKSKEQAIGVVITGENQPRAVALTDLNEIKASTRRNAASVIERTNRFTNISDGLIPYKTSGYGSSNLMDIRDAVVLCQKAYYNIAIFRNTIDLMSEFSTSPIYFRGGNSKSRSFFEAFFKKINLFALQDRFFREYYRSGNVFVYRFEAELKQSDISEITKTFGPATAASNLLPVSYCILNPADIQVNGGMSLASPIYYKLLSDYELARLRNPQTPEEQQLFNSLSEDIKKQILSRSGMVSIPLDTDRITAVFYKKQDYEPFAVPMGYPVLDDLNWKIELKKMDMAMTRTMQQVILLVTMGAEPEKGGVNPQNLAAMQEIFKNESVGRVLIADYTTKAEFVIPQIADLLDPKKYEIVNQDIQLGLSNILIGNEKFANQSIKVQVFVERLKQAREAFINDFLLPEIRKISDSLNFKSFPTPYFEDINLKDAVEFSRLYTRLAEIGVLTPEEVITSFDTGRLPTPEESVESQKKLKDYKGKGYYQPVTGGPTDQKEIARETGDMKLEQLQLKQPAGRPKGTGKPIRTRKLTPIGGNFSSAKLYENVALASKLSDAVTAEMKEKLKRDLTAGDEELRDSVCELIISNEEPLKWLESAKNYVEKPIDRNLDRVAEIQKISLENDLDIYCAALVYHSKY